ncbi:MAG: MFS transporter, partial [Actinomycetota bacterium]|nr:MFS transporter [Actinomycetota bacterium]
MATPTDDPTPAAPAAGPAHRLLARAHLPFVLAAVAMVTTSAFADRAVSTVLPTVARDLDGLPWFGAATSAPLVSYLVATAVAGVWTD